MNMKNPNEANAPAAERVIIYGECGVCHETTEVFTKDGEPEGVIWRHTDPSTGQTCTGLNTKPLRIVS